MKKNKLFSILNLSALFLCSVNLTAEDVATYYCLEAEGGDGEFEEITVREVSPNSIYVHVSHGSKSKTFRKCRIGTDGKFYAQKKSVVDELAKQYAAEVANGGMSQDSADEKEASLRKAIAVFEPEAGHEKIILCVEGVTFILALTTGKSGMVYCFEDFVCREAGEFMCSKDEPNEVDKEDVAIGSFDDLLSDLENDL